MDLQTLIALVGAMTGLGGVFAFGVTVGRTRGVKADLEALDHKYHRLANWKDGLSKELQDTYVPRKELALELKPIHDALQRIEDAMARALSEKT